MKKGKFIIIVILISLLSNLGFAQIDTKGRKSESTLTIGNGTEESDLIPIRFSGTMSYSQTIYSASELSGNEGKIIKLSYQYNNLYGSSFTRPIKVYMGITDVQMFDWTDKKLPDDIFTLVYFGDVTFNVGEGVWEITLDTPYTYFNGNLAIKVERYNPTNADENDLGYQMMFFKGMNTTDMYSTLGYFWDDDLGAPWFLPQTFKPNVNITFGSTGTELKGTITDNSGNPINNAKVAVSPSLYVYSNNQGIYSFKSIEPGTYDVTATCYGYATNTRTGVTVIENQTNTADITMQKLQSYILSGSVKNTAGNAIPNAEIYLKGYENYKTVADNQGNFSIDVLKANGYTLTVLGRGYVVEPKKIDMNKDETMQIVLKEALLPVARVKSELLYPQPNEEAKITWDSPTEMLEFRYDNGVVGGAMQLGGGAKVVQGSVYPTPTVLEKMSWMTIKSIGGDHPLVNVFIFDVKVDEYGDIEPTSKLLFSQMDVPNTDNAWTTFTFPTPVECPNGFYVAISSTNNNPVGLAHDPEDSNARIDYPYIPYTGYFSYDYTSNIFASLTSQGAGFKWSYMIRAEGYAMKKAKSATSQTVVGYNVFRFLEKDKPFTSRWTLLTENPITETVFVDTELKNTAVDGTYQYAVRAIYRDGVSQAEYSGTLTKGMDSDVTLIVTLNVDDMSIQGATVRLKSLMPEYSYEFNTTISNTDPIVIGTVRKGEYNIAISLQGFSKINQDIVISKHEETLRYELTEIPNPPVRVVAVADEAKVDVEWMKPADVVTFRYDNGVMTNYLGLLNGTAQGLLGSVHRVPSILNNMSWSTSGSADADGPHKKVNIFVMDLDNQGNPTSTVLFSKMNVTNTDDKWNTFTFPIAVECPRGFMIALSYDGFIGLGADTGQDSEWPFIADGNYYTADYATGVYTPLSGNVSFNLFVRAEGVKTGEKSYASFGYVRASDKTNTATSSAAIMSKICNPIQTPQLNPKDASKAFKGYKVWRTLEEDQASESRWVLLTPTAITATDYTDNSWASLNSGAYKYAVKAIYTNDVMSNPAFSNMVAKGMNAQVTINVDTNIDSNTNGATVVMTNKDNNPDHVYTANVVNGKVNFVDVWKGTYNILITLDGFKPLNVANVAIVEDNVELSYTLSEIVITPYNLEVIGTDTTNSPTFRWNSLNTIQDNFERHEDFRINSGGEAGWSYIDGDGKDTYGILDITYPNSGKPMAFMVFNPSKTNPSVADLDLWAAHSGDKYLASFGVTKRPLRQVTIG